MIAADQASAAEEKIMTKAMGFVSALIFALGTAPAARAQVMLDVSKITCEQFAGYKITTPQNIAIWLSGELRPRIVSRMAPVAVSRFHHHQICALSRLRP